MGIAIAAFAVALVPALHQNFLSMSVVVILLFWGVAVIVMARRSTIQVEEHWHVKLAEFRDCLQEFCALADKADIKWRTIARAGAWPHIDPGQPLASYDPSSESVLAFAQTIYPRDRQCAVLSASDYERFHQLRRRLVNFFEWCGAMLRQRVGSFDQFVDRQNLKMHYRHIVLLLAYLQIALAKRDNTRTRPDEQDFWWLGALWCRPAQP